MSLLSDLAKAVLPLVPNLAQTGSLSRTSLGGLGGSLVTAGVSTGNWPLAGVGALVWAAPYVWGLIRHTDAGKALSAAGIPGVTVAINPSVAPQSVIDLAHDRNEPDIKTGFVQTLR